MGPTDWQAILAPVLALVTVKDGVIREVRDVGISVAAGRGIVRSSHKFQDVKSIGDGGHQAAALCEGCSQRSIRRRSAGGNMCLGTIPWTALGGIEL